MWPNKIRNQKFNWSFFWCYIFKYSPVKKVQITLKAFITRAILTPYFAIKRYYPKKIKRNFSAIFYFSMRIENINFWTVLSRRLQFVQRLFIDTYRPMV